MTLESISTVMMMSCIDTFTGLLINKDTLLDIVREFKNAGFDVFTIPDEDGVPVGLTIESDYSATGYIGDYIMTDKEGYIFFVNGNVAGRLFKLVGN